VRDRSLVTHTERRPQQQQQQQQQQQAAPCVPTTRETLTTNGRQQLALKKYPRSEN